MGVIPNGPDGITPGPVQDATGVTGGQGIQRLSTFDQPTAEVILKELFVFDNMNLGEIIGVVFNGLRAGISLPLALAEAIIKKLLGLPDNFMFFNLDHALATLKVVPGIADLVEALTGFEDGDLADLGTWFLNLRSFLASINFFDPNFNLGAAAAKFVNLIIGPTGLLATLTNGLLNALTIPFLDASKILTGLFPISRIGNLQDTLDAFDHAISNNPAVGALIDKIVNALGIPGTGHNASTVWDALKNIPGPNIGSAVSGDVVPPLDATKILYGKLDKLRFPNLTRDMSSDLQGAIDAGINALRNTPGAVGQAFEDFEDALAAVPTAIFNKFGGNSAPRASIAQADAALQTMQSTVNSHTAAISALQSILDGAGGFSSSVMFRQPETTSYITDGVFTWTPPSWFVLGTDWLDGIILGAGSGAQGSNFGTPGASGSAGTDSTLVVNGATHTGAGGAANVNGTRIGIGPGPITFLDILYPGGADQWTDGAAGKAPGGGGCSVTAIGVHGGSPGAWDTFSVIPTSATITGTVGDGGNGGGGTHPGGSGRDGVAHVRARPAMPSQFTSMGTQILPTYKLNTGVAQTDAMTAAASWSRVPPGGASGGHMLKIRGNAAGTTYVYLRVWYIGEVTYWALGQVTSGVAATPWKTGTIAEAIPFNAFSVTSDEAWTFTVRINGSGFDSFTDALHTSSRGASYRSFFWASSDSALPGSIVQFVALDSGTPARITSAEVATAQTTTSTTYADLGTPGPSVTLDVPASGEVTVDLSAMFQSAGVNQQGFMGVVLSGANTLAAADARAASITGNPSGGVQGVMSRRLHLTGLTPGTTLFKAQFRTSVNTATFSNRMLIVDPRP